MLSLLLAVYPDFERVRFPRLDAYEQLRFNPAVGIILEEDAHPVSGIQALDSVRESQHRRLDLWPRLLQVESREGLASRDVESVARQVLDDAYRLFLVRH